MICYVEPNFSHFKNFKITNINTETKSFINYGWDCVYINNCIGFIIDMDNYNKKLEFDIVNDAYDYIITQLRKEKLNNILNENY
jgi:hypothetical protein